VRTTNLIQRSFAEERSCLKLAFPALQQATRRWQKVTISELQRCQLALLRTQLQPNPTPTESKRCPAPGEKGV
jgi:hypothetical protein